MKKTLTRREKVLEAALALIAEGGFHGSPMSELARISGVAVGTIYHHFDSKESLIHALYEQCREQMSAAMLESVSPGHSVTRRMHAMWHGLFTYLVKHPREFALIRQYQQSPFVASRGKREHRLFSREVLAEFRNAVASGKARKLRPELLADLFFSLVSGAASHHLGSSRISGKELEDIAGLTWEALRR